MSFYDHPPVPPMPQRRASKYDIDHTGNDVDISTLWLKMQQVLEAQEQMIIYLNEKNAQIETLQEQVADLTARVEELESP